MQRVYLIVNDCPSDFGEKEIIAVFMHRTKAQAFLVQRKNKLPYECQYWTIQCMNTEDT